MQWNHLSSFRFLAMTTIPTDIRAVFFALLLSLLQKLCVILLVCHLWIISDNDRMHRVEDIPKVVPKKQKWRVCTTIRLANRMLYFHYPILPLSLSHTALPSPFIPLFTPFLP